MRFKTDENLPRDVCVALHNADYEATRVVDQDMVGALDAAVEMLTVTSISGDDL